MGRNRRDALLVGGVLGAALALAYSVAVDIGKPTGLPDESAAVKAAVPSAPASFTVLAGGDVLIHPALTEQALADSGTRTPDFGPLLAGIAPTVTAADLALCHLEVPLAEPGGPYAGYPNFSAPPQVASALARAGYDSCSTASNHALDQGRDGVRRTLDALDAAGVAHTGSARSAAEAARPVIFDLGVARVAQVSFSYGYNGHELPPDAPWLANTLDADAVLRAARAAKRAGADVVIASLHWGAEYQAEPTEHQRTIARRLLADPAVDLIVGHHTHVVQPFERIGGEWVAYGLGNQVARHSEPRGSTEEGAMARFTFSREPGGEWRVTRAEYLPTLIDLGPPIRLLDLSRTPPSARSTEALTHIDQSARTRDAAEAGLTRPGP